MVIKTVVYILKTLQITHLNSDWIKKGILISKIKLLLRRSNGISDNITMTLISYILMLLVFLSMSCKSHTIVKRLMVSSADSVSACLSVKFQDFLIGS